MTVIDTPAGINHFRLAATISALSLELKGMQMSRGSVYHIIRRDYIEGLPERATLRNKCLAMRTFLDNVPEDFRNGPVCALAAETLTQVMAEKGWQFTA